MNTQTTLSRPQASDLLKGQHRDAAKVFHIDPNNRRQTIDNFGASDSWTVEPLINVPLCQREEIATLLFDPEKGIGLSAWRHNLGGGLNRESITAPLRTVETYDSGEGRFDFTRTPGQTWMLEAARRHGVGDIVAYSVTPPRRLTTNGLTNCTDGEGTTNLRDGEEEAFARYLAGIVSELRDQGHSITYLSPINEPDFEWNGSPVPHTQEGNRASNADILRQTLAIKRELVSRGLPVEIVTPEATSPQVGYEVNETMTSKYGAEYGAYATWFSKEAEWRGEVDPIYAYHSYWAEGLGEIIPKRRRLREELDKTPGLRAWMTEYCQLAGPRGEGGSGRDLGMGLALNLARLVHFDLTVVEASAWQWWLAVSDADFKDGLIYVDDIGSSWATIYPSKSLWALGHFSRFVRPGYVRLQTDPCEDPTAPLASAYQCQETGRVVLVLINPSGQSREICIDLPGNYAIAGWITSDRPGEDLARWSGAQSLKGFVLPSRSILTVTADPA